MIRQRSSRSRRCHRANGLAIRSSNAPSSNSVATLCCFVMVVPEGQRERSRNGGEMDACGLAWTRLARDLPSPELRGTVEKPMRWRKRSKKGARCCSRDSQGGRRPVLGHTGGKAETGLKYSRRVQSISEHVRATAPRRMSPSCPTTHSCIWCRV